MKIQELELFRGLTEEEMKKSLVCARAQVADFHRDDYILMQGETPKWLYLILSGTVLMEQVNAAGRQTYAQQLEEQQQFGVLDLFLERTQYTYSVKAKTDVRVLEVSRHFFYGACPNNCEHHNKLLLNMMHLFAKEADRNVKTIQLLTCGSLRQRIALFLLQNSHDGRTVEIDMNREELASSLNAARPSLSRELSLMQEEGILKLDGRRSIMILDEFRLREDLAGLEIE